MRRERAFRPALAALTLLAVVVASIVVVAMRDGRRGRRAPPRLAGIEHVRADHPRIWLDAARVAWLREKVRGRSTAEVVEEAGETAPGLALAALATGDASLCARAFAKRREGGWLHHVALLYDWCHAHLSEREKAELRALLVPRVEADMKNRRLWRSFHNAGHTAAFDVTLAALALHGDDPLAERALAFVRPELEDMLAVFDEVFPDGDWAEGADYARHASHHGLRTLLALKSATGVDALASSPHLRNVSSFVLYATKPNGLMWNGDDNDWPYLSGWERMALLMSASAFHDRHAQWMLNHCTVERFRLVLRDRWAELLWRDPALPEAPLDELPKARLFRGKGLVIARSGWAIADEPPGSAPAPTATAWLAFTSGDYFGDHDHFDVNAFQLHYGGDLAIDSGRYDDDWEFVRDERKLPRSQFFNYYQRTIAHNTMLVLDPSERFPPGFLNDGGQRQLLAIDGKRNVPEDYAQGSFPSDDGVGTHDWTTNPGRWDRADVTAYLATKDVVFARGDGTRAYAASKLSAFVRDLVFVPPRIVVVFDRVVSTNASFEKTWLLHTIDEPRLADDGSWFEVTEGRGRLFGVPVLPERRRLSKIGGPGEEHVVAGVRLASGPRSELAPSELHYGERPGAWRIEARPAEPRTEDHFLHVMVLGDRTEAARPVVETTANDDGAVAIRVAATDGTRAALRFAKGARPAVHLVVERHGKTTFDAALPDRVVLDAPNDAPR